MQMFPSRDRAQPQLRSGRPTSVIAETMKNTARDAVVADSRVTIRQLVKICSTIVSSNERIPQEKMNMNKVLTRWFLQKILRKIRK